MGVLSPAPAG